MPRKTTAALIAALGINFALAGGALMLANLNKPAEYEPDAGFADGYSDIRQVAGTPVDAERGDLAVALSAAQRGGNTRVTFQCGKDMGAAGREEHEGTWDAIAGAVLYRPDDRQMHAVEAKFDTRSLRTDANGLTQTVTVKEKWFDIDDHPIATFVCDSVKPADAGATSHTHELHGAFTLNGTTKPLTIPATLAFNGQAMTLDASFTILRSDYGVQKRESSVAGTVGGAVAKVDDAVQLTVRINASPDPAAALADLAALVEAQQEQLRIAGVERERLLALERRIEMLEERTDRISRRSVPSTPLGDRADLPRVFRDYSPGRFEPAPFEMVLVPGDPASELAPFYMSKTEVTWAMLGDWADHYDISDPNESEELEDLGHRPSKLYGGPRITLGFDQKDIPAMGMSKTTAIAYCRWLSEKTGRQYRLPTEQEWLHALALGGGIPEDLNTVSWYAGNAPKDTFTQLPTPSPAGTKGPNELGIHDMIGSVAEWVAGTGTQRVVLGGSVLTPHEEISPDWRMVEDLDVWSANFPQDPKSRFWYSDFYYTGIRLVCEAPSVAANPPEESE